MQKISILNGSVFGKAMEMADIAEEFLQEKGVEVEILEELKSPQLLETGILLVITSTTGAGEIPGNIMPSFLDWKQTKPNLEPCVFGVIGLGDSNYEDTYCAASDMFEEFLKISGAKQACSSLKLDASQSPDYETEIKAWLEQFLA